MKLAILSDIHDNIWALRTALGALAEAEALLCCGDLCSPFVINNLARDFPDRPIHIIFGNNDGDLYRITQLAARHPRIQLHGELFVAELDGCRVAANHYPEIAANLVASARYDLVCYGHNHRYAIERQGETQIINPGPIMGYDPAAGADVPSSCVLYDTRSHQLTTIHVTATGASAVG